MLSLRSWVNEGLMCFFFFGVGLEIKKEVIAGSLSSPQTASLPCVAALGGMIVPMGVYWVINRCFKHGCMAAVTVPMATDIAFALGVYGFFKGNVWPTLGAGLVQPLRLTSTPSFPVFHVRDETRSQLVPGQGVQGVFLRVWNCVCARAQLARGLARVRANSHAQSTQIACRPPP